MLSCSSAEANWGCLQALVGCADGTVLLWDLCPFQARLNKVNVA